MTPNKDRIQQAFDIPILAFHKVDPRWEWGVTRVTPRQFASVVRFLKDHGYETLTLTQALNPEFPLPPKPVILTFDGHVGFDLLHEDRLDICKSHEKITLFKPPDHSYFKILRTKLMWGGTTHTID